jgi:hypothetical protein
MALDALVAAWRDKGLLGHLASTEHHNPSQTTASQCAVDVITQQPTVCSDVLCVSHGLNIDLGLLYCMFIIIIIIILFWNTTQPLGPSQYAQRGYDKTYTSSLCLLSHLRLIY